MSNSTANDDFPLVKWASICVGGVLVVLALVWAILTFCVYPIGGGTPQDPTAARGQFGDMFGLANALFSGLAFSALIVSLSMQRKELGLQRDELSLTRAEMVKQAAALNEQAKTMAKQAQTELLAARIVGAGALMKLGQEASGEYLAQHLVLLGKNPTSVLKDNILELQKLLNEAEKFQVQAAQEAEAEAEAAKAAKAAEAAEAAKAAASAKAKQ